MKKLWITYSWKDDTDGDIRFIAQELRKKGIDVKLDKWDIDAGKRLWGQIDKFITDSSETDGWAIVATQNSLGSEACKEEIAYALDRALKIRDTNFPLIGIFPSTVDDSLIPAAIKTRLYVSTVHDDNWKERIVASLEGRKPDIEKNEIESFAWKVHTLDGEYVIEMRPRAGTWSPFFCAIPISEKERIEPNIFRAAKGKVPNNRMAFGLSSGPNGDNSLWIVTCEQEATPTMSYYLSCKNLPSKVFFGEYGSSQQYWISFRP